LSDRLARVRTRLTSARDEDHQRRRDVDYIAGSKRIRTGGTGVLRAGCRVAGVVTGKEIQQQPAYRVGETLEVVPGLIVTQHSGGLREDLYYGSDESTLQANSGTIVQAITSPKGNLIFGPWNQTEYYLSVGQGFHSNDLRGALTHVDALATQINFQQGNPTVVTQGKTPLLTKATGYELGVRSEPVPNLKLEGALFVLNLASEATFDGDEAMTTPGRPSQRKGVELSASYKPLPWLRLDGDFAATHARYADGDPGTGDTEPGRPGSYIPNAANVIATAGATIEDLGPWFGALKFRYFGRRPLSEDDSVTSRPTTLVDLSVGYKFSEQARVWLDIFNLFNNTGAHQIDYFYPSQLANETAPVYDVHFKPVDPLSVRLTLSMTF
jgi:outer membrane receptor protein involved in Fe transport